MSESRAFWFAHQLAQVKLAGADTGGHLAAVEVTSPAGPAAPLHVHSREDESFYVLDGELTFFIGARTEKAGAGALVHAPREVPHTFTVDSPTARWLVLSTPSGFERFVERVGVPADALELPADPEPADPERVTAAAAEFGIEILGPPPTMSA
jgi:quercetin dioxygenase-like cupin family protein